MTDPPDRSHGTGLRRDQKDRRDRALYREVPNISALPAAADCSQLLPGPLDQGPVGACTGFSSATVLYAIMRKDNHRRPFIPSPVFLYREARVLGGYVEEDAGAEIRNVWKAASRLGLPPMSNLKPRFKAGDLAVSDIFPPGSIWRREPSPGTYADAERRQVLSYHRLEFLEDLLQCLADGWPATIGVELFRDFYGPDGEPPRDVPDPIPGQRGLGGHAVAAFGYQNGRVLIRNSWGAKAHQGGPDFTLSFAYVREHAWDMWTGRLIEGSRL